MKVKSLIYRFRDIDKLLNEKYAELDKQTIYFSAYEDLNDPMEGLMVVTWDGDDIAWQGLFKHYILCLERTFTLYRLEAPLDKLKSGINIYLTDFDLPTEQYKNLCNELEKEWLCQDVVIKMIEVFSQRKVNQNELSVFLKNTHLIALSTIMNVHHKYNLIGDKEKVAFEKLNKGAEQILSGLDAYLMIKDAGEEECQISFETVMLLKEEFELVNSYKDNALEEKYKFLMHNFAEEYVQQISRLVYPECYTACFSRSYKNSAMWGHYADKHKGVCLIFNTELKEQVESISVYQPYAYSKEGVSYDYRNRLLEQVLYSDDPERINFFSMLGRLNGQQLSFWLADGKARSRCYDMYGDTEAWRKEYWEKYKKIYTTKTKDWRYEEECRLTLDNSFSEYNSPKDRALKYKFNSLAGIVFGIKTTNEDKVKIIKIIIDKCKKEERSDFKFYQAKYSRTAKEIKKYELPNLCKLLLD